MSNASPIDSEKLITPALAAKLGWLPPRRNNKRPHVSWFYRQMTAGTRGVVLEHRRVGSTLCTSEGALRRFFKALSDLPHESPNPPTINVATAHAAAEAELQAAGI